jgi:hypothetical protein
MAVAPASAAAKTRFLMGSFPFSSFELDRPDGTAHPWYERVSPFGLAGGKFLSPMSDVLRSPAGASAAPPASTTPAARRGTPSSPPPEYEFSDAHKESFRALAASVSFVGVCTMLFGAMSAVFALGAVYAGFASQGLALLAGAAVSLLTAWWTVSAGRALSSLVATRGRDIGRLMEAVVQLRRLFGFARVVIIMMTFGVVAIAAGIVYCSFLVEKGGRCFAAFG